MFSIHLIKHNILDGSTASPCQSTRRPQTLTTQNTIVSDTFQASQITPRKQPTPEEHKPQNSPGYFCELQKQYSHAVVQRHPRRSPDSRAQGYRWFEFKVKGLDCEYGDPGLGFRGSWFHSLQAASAVCWYQPFQDSSLEIFPKPKTLIPKP